MSTPPVRSSGSAPRPTAGGGPEGASESYAVAIDTAEAIAEQIRAGDGSNTIQIGIRGFLGVEVDPNTVAASGVDGAVIAGVLTGTPAADAGLQPGDVITSVGGEPVESDEGLTAGLHGLQPGDKVTVDWTDGTGGPQRNRDARDRPRLTSRGPCGADVGSRSRDPLRVPDRPGHVHRLPRLHRRLQGRARRATRGQPHLGEVHREGGVPRRAPLLSVLRCNHCDDAPCITICPTRRCSAGADGIVDFDDSRLHRLQVVHERLPVRRPLHQPGDADRAQVQLLRPPRRRRAGAELRHRLPDAVDRRRRPRRPDARIARRWPVTARWCARPSRARGRRSSTRVPTRPRSTRCARAIAARRDDLGRHAAGPPTRPTCAGDRGTTRPRSSPAPPTPRSTRRRGRRRCRPTS